MTSATGSGPVELDELDVTVVIDNATDTLSSVAAGVPQRPEVAYLLGSVPPTGEHDGHARIVVFDRLCVACHGFSALVTARRDDVESTALFDVGPYGDVWLANAARLGIDLSRIDALFLSHWHWDHSGGISAVVAAIAAARRDAGRAPILVDVHPDRPDQRGILTPAGVFAMLPQEPTIQEIEAAGGRVVTNADAHPIGDGLIWSSGDIPRQTAYETGLAGHHSWQGATAAADPEIRDERFLAAAVRGRGATVITACSHAGVVNVGLEARRLIGPSVDLLLGGYHLAGGPMEERIEPTVRDLANLVDPTIVAPGHCTGWRAAAALAEEFAPGAYAPSVVGARYVLRDPSLAEDD